MKRIIVYLLVFIVAISFLFRGLFFAYETWPFITSIALLLVAYLLVKLATRESMRLNKWVTVFGMLLIVAYALSFINAANTRENISAAIRYTEYYILSCIFYDYYCSKEKHFAMTVMVPVVLSGFINAIVGIEALSGAFPILAVTTNSYGKRVGATFQYTNTAAAYFIICLIFTITLVNTIKKPLYRYLLIGIGNTLFLAMFLTVSRGGFIICGFALLLLIIFQPSGYKIKTLGNICCTIFPAFLFVTHIYELTGSRNFMFLTGWLALSFITALILGVLWNIILRYTGRVNIRPATMRLIAFLSVFAILLAFSAIGFEKLIPQIVWNRFARLNLSDRNIYIRIVFVKDALKLIADNWLLGLGGGGWTSAYYSVQEEFYTARAVHNHYLEVFVESGILGFASFTGLVLTSLIFLMRTLQKSEDADKKTLVLGFLCALLSLLVHCSFDFDLNYVSVALLLWLLIAGSAIFHHGVAAEGEEQSISWATSSKTIKLVGIIMCAAIFSLGGVYSLASWHANKGLESVYSGNIAQARSYYEKAFSLDSLNPRHTFELAKIYNYYAGKTADPENSRLWRERAIQASEKSMTLDRYYPAYREMAVRTYLDAGMPERAFGKAEELLACQPCKDSNYELLARSYLEAGIALMDNGEAERGRELLVKCTQIEDRPDPDVSKVISNYREKAAELLEYRRKNY